MGKIINGRRCLLNWWKKSVCVCVCCVSVWNITKRRWFNGPVLIRIIFTFIVPSFTKEPILQFKPIENANNGGLKNWWRNRFQMRSNGVESGRNRIKLHHKTTYKTMRQFVAPQFKFDCFVALFCVRLRVAKGNDALFIRWNEASMSSCWILFSGKHFQSGWSCYRCLNADSIVQFTILVRKNTSILVNSWASAFTFWSCSA